MPSFNKVFLMGNLTKDPELRYTSGGAPVANLRMAINRVYKLQTGEQKEEVCYVTVVVWRKQAEAAGEHLKKGDPVFVEGRLQSRSWEAEGGQKRSTMEVVAERVQFLARGTRSATSGGDAAPEVSEETAPAASDEDIPF
jgi:single-strand DNA-binding protein